MGRPFEVRSYRPSDREALRTAAAETVWLGEPRDVAIPDRHTWAELTTRYFTDREPEHTWVVAPPEGSDVLGFLTGTRDVRRLGLYLARIAPELLLHASRRLLLLRSPSRRAIVALVRAAARGELAASAKVRAAFPGTFRFAMRPAARGYGLGAHLVERYLTAMQGERVRGVHAQTVSVDEEAAKLLQRAGFQLAASWPLSVLRHVEPEVIDLLTWVLPL